ncbi:MAG: hypothetical protein E7526_02120 [Ruminococcaceae bacterium]|nr:hypothetical protein [Oscillospiraceae bacterium]
MKRKWYALLALSCLAAIICFAFLVAAIALTVIDVTKYDTYQIKIETICIENNNVGSEWSKIFIMDGQEISNKHRIKVPKGEIVEKTMNVKITEHDKYSDSACVDMNFLLRKNERVVKTVKVIEDNGRYKGNTASWKIKISVK